MNIFGVIWRWSGDLEERDQLLNDITAQKRTRDIMWMTNGDKLAGRLAPVAAPAGGLTEIRIIPRTDSPPLTALIDNVITIGLETESASAPSAVRPIAAIGMRDGSVLWAAEISPGPAQIEITLLDGPKLTAETERFWSNVTGIQFFSDKVTYLSDLPTVGFKHIPFLSAQWKYGIDKNDLGNRLRSGRTIFLKGIGMHSTSRLAYELGQPYRRFEADVAVDDVAGRQGSVVFRVFVERTAGKQSSGLDETRKASSSSWQVAYTSSIVRGGDPPIPVSVDISQAVRIALVVDFADRGDEQDHANWLNARLMQ